MMDTIAKVKAAGVIGAGGAGFPTHAKLVKAAEYILLNGAECEPLLRVDQQLMEQNTDAIITGLAAAGTAVNATKAIIGIKRKHKHVIAVVTQRIKELGLADYMAVTGLQDCYPAGDEQVLVYELTGRIVGEGSIPLSVGCVVINAETALNINQALHDIPVTDTFLTIAGAIEQPLTVKVPVGMAIRELLCQCGVVNPDAYAVIDGGPMMGSVLPDLNGYVSKKSKGYILLSREHYLIKKKTVSPERARIIGRTACEQCRMCTDLCPRHLLGHNVWPHKIMRALSYDLPLAEQQSAQLCCECNACELFSCPANLHPRSVNKLFKGRLAAAGLKYQPAPAAPAARTNRDYRLIPTARLISRLGLTAFDRSAPLSPLNLKPEVLRIALNSHIGAIAAPVVTVGDTVSRGQLIAQVADTGLGAAVHASLSGVITAIEPHFIEIKVGAYV